uniref:Uncharacterized protein n=1 Tax=Rhizophora mucronata TaxID=61149 RepID=A0A2P2QKQ5_RHIMU
MACQGFSGI